jgi:hypothetical protein
MELRLFGLAVVVLCAVSCSDPEALQSELQLHLENRGAELSILLNEANAGAIQRKTGLLVQLAFGAEADLDLYVTDPLLETVYFANHESKSGGKISDDARCDEQPFRIEEVWFNAPIPGRYRVGVDFPEQCNGSEEAAAYVVSVLQDGKRKKVSGSVSLRQFEVIVLEFEVEFDLEIEVESDLEEPKVEGPEI